MYAEVILPLSLPTLFFYRVPGDMEVKPGMRVEVPLGKSSLYKGIIYSLSPNRPEVKNIRDIISILDPYPLVGREQLEFWTWLAEYYMCSVGEVFRTAMPRGLKEKYSPRYEVFSQLNESYRSEAALSELLDNLERAPKQLLILQWMIEVLSEKGNLEPGVRKSSLNRQYGFSPSAYAGLLKKKIISEYSERAVRMPDEGRKLQAARLLTNSQQLARENITELHKKNPVVLLKGVTSSGKTEIYIHLIQEMIRKGKQVLYLLPEIALTTQIIERLRKVFGDKVGIYHSKYSDAERVETFLRARENDLAEEYSVILGARSAVFLPFRNLGLIIIDEEHEHSYKQADPAPRYHARDAAIMLAGLYRAKILLGSATPSFESYYNARTGKFGLVELDERFGTVSAPEIRLGNLRDSYRKKRMISHFTPELHGLMSKTLEENRQVILFQNRRGFSPYIECFACGWIPTCRDCDVSLVYHKKDHRLICHYCGYSEKPPHQCPDCSETKMHTRGFGTEMIEEEVGDLFPGYRVQRMDLDTTRSRKKYERIIRSFESGSIHILIGTQIVTKGLDFENVGLVGVLNADNLLAFPDFRSYERSYQLLSQVAGRSGRKDIRGTVLIQTSLPDHPVLQQVLHGNYHKAYMNQMEDRQAFRYPPYFRLMKIILKHKDLHLLEKAANEIARALKKELGVQESKTGILGPQSPVVSRVQNMHISLIMIKFKRTNDLSSLKAITADIIFRYRSENQYRNLFIIPDVDPY